MPPQGAEVSQVAWPAGDEHSSRGKGGSSGRPPVGGQFLDRREVFDDTPSARLASRCGGGFVRARQCACRRGVGDAPPSDAREADKDRLAVTNRHRDALRHRRGKQVIAVDDQSDYPEKAPRTDLSGFNPNVEAIASNQPDLVVLSDNTVEDGLKQLGIKVLVQPAADQPQRRATRRSAQLGKATGHASRCDSRRRQDEGGDRRPQGAGAEAVKEADRLLRARRHVLLGDFEDVHRAGAVARRPRQHRRQGRR